MRGERVVDLTLLSIPSLQASNANCWHIGQFTRMQKTLHMKIDTYTRYFYASELKCLKLTAFFFLVYFKRKFIGNVDILPYIIVDVLCIME